MRSQIFFVAAILTVLSVPRHRATGEQNLSRSESGLHSIFHGGAAEEKSSGDGHGRSQSGGLQSNVPDEYRQRLSR